MEDYRRYYNLESYLFEEVGPRFRERGRLSAFDFFCIVVWKNNNAKSRIRTLLRSKGEARDLNGVVEELTRELWKKPSAKEKMRYLMEDWRFRLPIASAILTVLEPDDFTVYDKRVADAVNASDLQGLVWSDSLWNKYLEYREEVERQGPQGLSLREKGRWLWGKNFHDAHKRWLTESPAQ